MTQKIVVKICAVIMGVSGFIILFSTLFPIFSYEWEAAQKYPTLISPLVDEEKGSFVFSGSDYTKASNWFPAKKDSEIVDNGVSIFTISVPDLNIDNALVRVGGEDLSESLVLFRGTALPGQKGNAVIFGHSILPQYYDPKNYLSIFSTLPTMEKGGLIYANYDGIVYTYKVKDMFEVKPTDVAILDQNVQGHYITLVTCTPPGHPLKPKRLIVRAELIPTDI